jgi:hypothetical protein
VLDPPLKLEPVPFVMSWHRRNDVHPAQRWFRDCIASLPAIAPISPAVAPGSHRSRRNRAEVAKAGNIKIEQ